MGMHVPMQLCAQCVQLKYDAPTLPMHAEIFDAARAIDCTGIRLETFANHCSSRGQNPGCADPNDVCFVKSGTHSQCRPRDRTLPTCWDSVEAVYCSALLSLSACVFSGVDPLTNRPCNWTPFTITPSAVVRLPTFVRAQWI